VRNKDMGGTIVISFEGIIQSFNSEAENSFEVSAIEMINSPINSIIPELVNIEEVSLDILHQTYGKKNNGETFSFYYRLHKFNLQNAEHFLLTIQDIRNRSKLQQELYQSLSEVVDIKYALDESSIVAVTDNKGKIKYVNNKFCQISKYTHEELIGQDHRIINSGYHSKEFFRDLWKTISQGKVWKGEIKNKAKDGTFYWVDTTIVPFLDENNKPYQYLAIRTEVTEYKKNQEKLQKSINELSDLKFALDESTIVAITDRKGIITYVNKQFCDVSKYDYEELIGQDHALINSGYHSKEFFKDLWKTIGQGKVWKGEIKNKAKDGSYYWVDTTIVPFLDEKNRPYQYLAIRSEITDRKIAEEEIQQIMIKMMHLQEEERKHLSRELHDGIGQSLYSLMISINRLRAEFENPIIDQMHYETTQLIEEIRDISWELRPSVLDDLGLIPAIRSFITRFAEHHGINVDFNFKLTKRLTDDIETTIYRIIQEALTNIRKYAGVDNAEVEIINTDDQIEVEIKDNGNGFSLENRPSGVGLFSMEERARAVHGKIEISSELGKGTSISLVIPLNQ
jgi:two-component system, NarL family, sensor histidine kinase NreB